MNLADGSRSTLSTALVRPFGVALEAGGASALVTDCGTSDCASSGRLVRVDLASGVVTPITPASLGLRDPRGVAIEAGGTSALVTERFGPRLIRVDFSSGGVTTLSTGFTNIGPVGAAIESGGVTALVSDSCLGVDRVNLASGAVTHVATIPAPGYCLEVTGVAIESGGVTNP